MAHLNMTSVASINGGDKLDDERTTQNFLDFSDLAYVASLTNRELFTKVIATIKQSLQKPKHQKKEGGEDETNWQSAAIRVAVSASKGEDNCCCKENWVQKFRALSTNDDTVVGGAAQSNNFRDAFATLPARECYRRRLGNALSALSALEPSYDGITVRQVAGLVRCAVFLSSDNDDGDDANANSTDIELQANTMSHLWRIISRVTSNPCEMFLSIQLPTLQKLKWDIFLKGGVKFASIDEETTFRSLLNLDFGDKLKPDVTVGVKRKRISDMGNIHTSDTIMYSTVLEGAHLARFGNVRAQHGAVIFIPPGKNGEMTAAVIGRGWNHDFFVEPFKGRKNKIVLHSEAHAVVDAIRNHGEDKCFDELFPRATVMIVELESDYAYETCHPCPKCDPLLRAVGIGNILHTTPSGKIESLNFSPANPSLLSNENVSIPFQAACDEQNVRCKRLERANVCKEAQC